MKRSGFRLARPSRWRLLIVAVLTWLIGSALFAPWLNPFMGPGVLRNAEIGSMLGMVRIQTSLAMEGAAAHYESKGRWPERQQDAILQFHPDLYAFDMPEPLQLRLTYGRNFGNDTGLPGSVLLLNYDPEARRWRCSPGQPVPPARWLPSDCRTSESGLSLLQWLLLAAVLALLALLLWLLLFDPRLRALQRAPRRLRRQPLSELPALDWRLRLLLRRRGALAAADIHAEDWQEALRWPHLPAAERAQLLAGRVGADSRDLAGWPLPGGAFEWRLPQSLPLALERVLVYLPPATLPARELVRRLHAQSTGQDVLLVLSAEPRGDAALLAWGSDPTHLGVAVDASSQSEWLLHPEPAEVLLALLARQLRVTRISPYQTRGGVTRPAGFFGRNELLARVLNREPGNYLLVGGRQLGKTSLMKAIERRFEGHPQVACQYLSLRDHRLLLRLAQLAQQPVDAPLDAVLDALKQAQDGRRLLLLIDECDLFLREEARIGYGQLAALRAQSEEGRCHFILAGFWDLYEAVALDFASPIRNFGEVIRLGALEREACLELATQPMKRLGLNYAESGLPERLVEACGQRANLVAIVCQQLLEQLGRGERSLGAAALESALASEAVQDALAGWSRLSPEPQACALDRALVYRIARNALADSGGLRMADWLAELDAAGVAVAPEAVRRSFARLQLAYVLLRDEGESPRPGTADTTDALTAEPASERGSYRFAVPLQARQFQADEVEALLSRELRALAS